jgi:hypothetical protein
MRAGKATVSNSCCRNGSIAARQSLPGYDLFIELESARKLLRVVPRRLSTGTVDSSVEAIRRLGATLSADQAHGSQLTLWPAERKRRPNESNSKDSNFCCWRPKLGQSHQRRCPTVTGDSAAMIIERHRQRGRCSTPSARHFSVSAATHGRLSRCGSHSAPVVELLTVAVGPGHYLPTLNDNFRVPRWQCR